MIRPLFSFFPSGFIAAGQAPEEIIWDEVIFADIEGGRWRKEIEALRMETNKQKRNDIKKFLPVIKTSGVFNGGSKEDLVEYNGYIQLDIDGMQPDEVSPVKNFLKTLPFIYAAFISPSGNGLKAIVRTREGEGLSGLAESEIWHLKAFAQIEEYLNPILAQGHSAGDGKEIMKLDGSTKAINKSLFISYDPELYFNRNSELWKVESLKDVLEEAPAKRQERPFSLPLSRSGNMVTPEDLLFLFQQADRLFPEMLFTWDDRRKQWKSPYGIGARKPTHPDKGKTVCFIGRSGTPVIHEGNGETLSLVSALGGIHEVRRILKK